MLKGCELIRIFSHGTRSCEACMAQVRIPFPQEEDVLLESNDLTLTEDLGHFAWEIRFHSIIQYFVSTKNYRIP
jgi:hypothetical protein